MVVSRKTFLKNVRGVLFCTYTRLCIIHVHYFIREREVTNVPTYIIIDECRTGAILCV